MAPMPQTLSPRGPEALEALNQESNTGAPMALRDAGHGSEPTVLGAACEAGGLKWLSKIRVSNKELCQTYNSKNRT